MNRLRLILKRLRGVRRPPTGPLTTAEQTTADELQRDTPPKDDRRAEPNQAETPPP